MTVRLCPVVVGREAELRELRTALRHARAGRARTVLLTGAAGIGESRPAAQVTADAAESGMATLTGRAVQAGRPEAFRPFTEALLSGLRTARPDDFAHLRAFRPAIGRLVPEWAQETPVTETSLVVLAEGVLRLLTAVAGGRGALLVLEDVHWADPETRTGFWSPRAAASGASGRTADRADAGTTEGTERDALGGPVRPRGHLPKPAVRPLRS